MILTFKKRELGISWFYNDVYFIFPENYIFGRINGVRVMWYRDFSIKF